MTAFDTYLGDTYDLVDVIKSTERSFVALVYDKNAKRLCVMKERNPQSVGLYKILRDLNNPHVPEIFRLFEQEGKLILVEEHIDGQTLGELSEYRPEILTERFVADIFVQICNALAPLHKADVIHRDLTPSNIMLTKENVIKLIDFGIARVFKPESTNDTEFLGTRGYAAPEQLGVFELGQTDARTDIFILGTTIKNLLGKDYRGRLAKVLNRCTDLNPAMRYQSVSDLLDAIKRARKLWLLKRFGLIAATACGVFLATQFINFESPAEELPLEEIAANTADEQPSPQYDAEEKSEPSPPVLSSDISNPLVDFANNPPPVADLVEVPEINIAPLPTASRPTPVQQPQPQPQTQPQPRQQSARHAKRVKLYLYLNGELSENRSEHSTASTIILNDDCKNWQRNAGGDYLFPADWTARLHIENFTGKDLLNPKVTVKFTRGGYSFDIPNVNSGQTRDVDIPIAGYAALKSNLRGNLTVAVKSPNGEPIPLLVRRLEIKS